MIKEKNEIINLDVYYDDVYKQNPHNESAKPHKDTITSKVNNVSIFKNVTDLQLLSDEIRKEGYLLKLLWRNHELAIYKKIDYDTQTIVSFEIHKIKLRDEQIIGKRFYPKRECLRCTEEFGYYAWDISFRPGNYKYLIEKVCWHTKIDSDDQENILKKLKVCFNE